MKPLRRLRQLQQFPRLRQPPLHRMFLLRLLPHLNNPDLRNAAATKVAAAKAVAALAAVAVVVVVVAVEARAAKSAHRSPTRMATNSPKRLCSSTAVRKS